jgi:hypothetical protein
MKGLITGLLIAASIGLWGQKISDKDGYFRIETPHGRYLLEQKSGGFSNIYDRDGKDWVAFKVSEKVLVPQSAAADFRGVPNLVYSGADGGVGHPGFDRCLSRQTGPHQIRTESKSGLWAWTWRFTSKYAVQCLEKNDTSRGYWFLYEGPVNARFRPAEQYWATDTDLGPRQDVPELMTGTPVMGQWQWAYFGDTQANRVLWVLQSPHDQVQDFFAYMGSEPGKGINSSDGMNVFGFGRGMGSKPLLRQEKVCFYIGFYEKDIRNATEHQAFARWLGKTLPKGVLKPTKP